MNGSEAGVGAYNQLSDGHHKKEVTSLAGSLEKVLAIRGVSYKWIDEERFGSDVQLGVIAQELEQIVPEVVSTGADGVKRVKYTDLIPLMIEAFKAERIEKDAKIAKLTARANHAEEESVQLKAESAQLKAESAALKTAFCSKFPDLPLCMK